ncbi:hypothetical protein [Pseudoduganella lutea]|uniref:hypothetical protein n=1 Tax=Pseudoduganella lutea TaxID=321985 RepID=UPI001A917340|nr:hypothetical protein [Pseudoduganella lutea]
MIYHPYQVAIAIALAIIAEVAIMLPLIRFLRTGWFAKRRDVLDGLSGEACRAYFEMFSCYQEPESGKEREAFEKMYTRWYGRKMFIAPGLLLFGVSSFAVFAVAFSVVEMLYYKTSPYFPLPAPAVAALSGAYMWVVDDQISRCRRLDMAPSDLHWGTLRLLIAVPMGYAFAAIVTDGLAPFVAFALGAFPISALTNMLQRTSNRVLQIEPKNEEVRDGIVKLQGTDRAIVDRLAIEDVRTVLQMAYCDPVHITMRSNLSFNFITDLMNQALVRLYFGTGCDAITPMGMRGAVEIRHFIEELDSDDTKPEAVHDRELARNTLPALAAALGLTEHATEQALRQIAYDPFTYFLYQIWTLPKGACPTRSGHQGLPVLAAEDLPKAA